MITTLKKWSAWAPGVTTQTEWKKWTRNPISLKSEGIPELSEIPAIRRRRLSDLSRMALKVTMECLKEDLTGCVNSVIASHHGEIQTMLDLTESLICQEPLSPNKFSHSVHNTIGGLISIESTNQSPTTSLCGGKASFCYGFLEALAMAYRYPNNPTLLVIVDVPMPDFFSKYFRPPIFPYALAVLLSQNSSEEGIKLQLNLDKTQKVKNNIIYPQALVFLQWLLSKDYKLTLNHHQQCWTWQKL